MNVPNHSQAARINADLKLLAARTPEKIKGWQGNSYQGRAYKHDGIWCYDLVHWNTTIAQFALIGGQVILTYFNARYISSTTRSFQGRILKGMTGNTWPALSPSVGSGWISMVNNELAQPTHKRGIISPEF